MKLLERIVRRYLPPELRNVRGQLGAGPLPVALAEVPPIFYYTPSFQSFLAKYPGRMLEQIPWLLYHIQAYATTGYTSLSFFGTTSGAATNGLNDTNMEVASTLPKDTYMIVRSIGVAFFPPEAQILGTADFQGVADAWDVLTNTCHLEWHISQKPYLYLAPLVAAPCGFGLSGFGAMAGAEAANTGVSAVNNGTPAYGTARMLNPPVGIPEQASFSVSLLWQALVTVAAASRIGVFLDGWKIRPIL